MAGLVPSLERVKEVVAASHTTTVVPVWKEWSLESFPGLGPEEAYLAVSRGGDFVCPTHNQELILCYSNVLWSLTPRF